jgi:hypothetical protein
MRQTYLPETPRPLRISCEPAKRTTMSMAGQISHRRTDESAGRTPF